MGNAVYASTAARGTGSSSAASTTAATTTALPTPPTGIILRPHASLVLLLLLLLLCAGRQEGTVVGRDHLLRLLFLCAPSLLCCRALLLKVSLPPTPTQEVLP